MTTFRTFKSKSEATDYFFNGGYESMNDLEQVEFLVHECGYTEEGALELVYSESYSDYYTDETESFFDEIYEENYC